jgi:hypothetical protein
MRGASAGHELAGVEQMQELLAATDRLDGGEPLDPAERATLLGVLTTFEQAARQRCDDLRTQLSRAEEFDDTLRQRLAQRTDPLPAAVDGNQN